MRERLFPTSLEFIFSLGTGLTAAGIPNVFPNIFKERPEMNAELAVGTSTLILGFTLGLRSNFRAEGLASEGKIRRAYLAAITEPILTAISFGISGGAFGAMAGRREAFISAAVCAVIGWGINTAANIYSVRSTLKK
ncbi:hypothetical protein HYU94_03330 [Candidatus Daviesbacteria bacterium]|nr:hypothetical protein [Candidatus Daviesbacteria bacterium]